MVLAELFGQHYLFYQVKKAIQQSKKLSGFSRVQAVGIYVKPLMFFDFFAALQEFKFGFCYYSQYRLGAFRVLLDWSFLLIAISFAFGRVFVTYIYADISEKYKFRIRLEHLCTHQILINVVKAIIT